MLQAAIRRVVVQGGQTTYNRNAREPVPMKGATRAAIMSCAPGVAGDASGWKEYRILEGENVRGVPPVADHGLGTGRERLWR